MSGNAAFDGAAERADGFVALRPKRRPVLPADLLAGSHDAATEEAGKGSWHSMHTKASEIMAVCGSQRLLADLQLIHRKRRAIEATWTP